MPQRKVHSEVVLGVAAAVLCGAATAQPSSWTCGTTAGGKTICVRFDNRSTAPQLDDDFTRNLGDPPSVTLKQGEDGSGVLHWRIKCYDNNGPADIGSISVDGSDNFEVTIADENDDPGTANLGSAELTPTNAYSLIASGSRIAGNLTGNVTVRSYGGDGGTLSMVIDGDVASTATIEAERVLNLLVGAPTDPNGAFAGSLIVHDNDGGDTIAMGTLEETGYIQLDGDGSGAVFTSLFIQYGGAGQIIGGTISSKYSYPSGVTLAQDGSEFSGSATFSGLDEAIIRAGTLTGTLRIKGDMHGTIRLWYFYGPGRILIDGSFNPWIRYGYPHDILIAYEMDDSAAVTIDANGYDVGDNWNTGGQVHVGGDFYTHSLPNNAELHIWETTACAGDMNNDGTINTFDINGFVAALTSVEAYGALYPGLEGTLHFKGDINSDGTFNPFDIDPFVALITGCTCYCSPPSPITSGGGSGESPDDVSVGTAIPIGSVGVSAASVSSSGGRSQQRYTSPDPGGGLSAEQAAQLFLDNTDPALVSGLISAVGDLVIRATGTLAEYWDDVQMYLVDGAGANLP